MSALRVFQDMFRFKAPDIEQSVMDMMHNPTPRSSMFPYLFFEEGSGLYHMQNGVIGFVLEASPIVGCSSSTYKQISMLFDDVLPEGSVLEVLLLASDNLDIPLDIWKHGRVSQNDVLKKLEEYRLEFLKGYNRASSSFQVSNFRLRDFRLFFSFSLRSKDLSKTVEFRDRLRSVLLSIGMSTIEARPSEFLKLSREIINYPSSAGSVYRENDLLSEQIIDLSNPILVELSGLRSGSNSCVSRCYEVDSYPKGFSISQMHNLLGSASDNMQIPCRFAISYVVSNELAESEQERYKTKGDLVVKQAIGLLGRFNKSLEDEGHEWNEIINHNLKNKEKLVRSSMTVLLSAPSSQIDRAEQNLMSLWRQNDFVLKAAFGLVLSQ